MLESLFNQVAGFQVCNFMKMRFQHRRFSVNIAKFLKTPILEKICERLFWLMSSQFFYPFIWRRCSYKCFSTGKHLCQSIICDKCNCRFRTLAYLYLEIESGTGVLLIAWKNNTNYCSSYCSSMLAVIRNF